MPLSSTGIFLLRVGETMRVEGRLHANGETGSGSGGGGAGGAILAYIKHLDGEGSLEVVGGRGRYIQYSPANGGDLYQLQFLNLSFM